MSVMFFLIDMVSRWFARLDDGFHGFDVEVDPLASPDGVGGPSWSDVR
jgi:hypothetical protein